MIALGFSLILAAANTCLYSSLARGYEGQLGRWTDLALLAGGFVGFLVVPLVLADRWITHRRRFLHTVEGPRVLLKALLAWNAVGAAAFGALAPRAELESRGLWLPGRLLPGALAAGRTEAAPAAAADEGPALRECKGPDGQPRITDGPCREGEALVRRNPRTSEPAETGEHAPALAVRTPRRPGTLQPWGLSTFQEDLRSQRGAERAGAGIGTAARAPAAGQEGATIETRRLEPNRAARDMLDRINAERRARGAPELRFDPVLARIAQDWAELSAQDQVLSHHVRGALGGHPHSYSEHYPPGWRGAAENVGFAVSVEQIFRGMYHEEQDAQGRCLPGRAGGHCRNILDPRLNAIGIGDAVKDGYHWNVQNFATY